MHCRFDSGKKAKNAIRHAVRSSEAEILRIAIRVTRPAALQRFGTCGLRGFHVAVTRRSRVRPVIFRARPRAPRHGMADRPIENDDSHCRDLSRLGTGRVKAVHEVPCVPSGVAEAMKSRTPRRLFRRRASSAADAKLVITLTGSTRITGGAYRRVCPRIRGSCPEGGTAGGAPSTDGAIAPRWVASSSGTKKPADSRA